VQVDGVLLVRTIFYKQGSSENLSGLIERVTFFNSEERRRRKRLLASLPGCIPAATAGRADRFN
jgi:hypothetical protein